MVILRVIERFFCGLMQMDEVLAGVADTLKNFAVIYLVGITEVPDFNIMYELYDPSTIMFFFRNKHVDYHASSSYLCMTSISSFWTPLMTKLVLMTSN
ncbi:Thioredoxin-like protein YLS8 [Linum grandiflorum]